MISLALTCSLLLPPASPSSADTTAMAAMLPAVDEHPGAWVGSSLAAHDNMLLAVADYSLGRFVRTPAEWGQVYVYSLAGGEWKPNGKLPRPDVTGLRFGYELDFDGVRAVVSSSVKTSTVTSAIVHVYARTPDGWALEQTIQHPALGANPDAVAIDNHTLAIGSGSAVSRCVLVFERDNAQWSLKQRIDAPLPGGSCFGMSIDLDGDVLVVGSRGEDSGAGAVYVYERKSGAWSNTARLLSPTRGDHDWLGQCVRVDGDLIAAGAPQFDAPKGSGDAPKGSGKVTLFRKRRGTWEFDTELSNPDAAPGDWFGTSLALDDDRIVVGAYGDDGPNGPTGSGSGSCSVFNFTAGSWRLDRKLVPADPANHTSFGCRVALTTGYVLAASVDTPNSSNEAGRIINRIIPARIFANPIDERPGKKQPTVER